MALPTKATSPTATPPSLSSGSFYKPHPHPSEGRQNENHNHKKLNKLITALSNSMKPWAVPCRATQEGWVMVESSDKTWSSGQGNGKPLQHSSLKWSEVTQLCPTLCDPMDCSLPGSSVHGILQARVLEWGCHFLLQQIFLTQGSNPGLPHCRQTL